MSKKIPYYFENPTQVKFYDDAEDTPTYRGGIAYQDKIICGCCGGVIEIEELLTNFGEKEIGMVIIPLEWIDISNEIKGE